MTTAVGSLLRELPASDAVSAAAPSSNPASPRGFDRTLAGSLSQASTSRTAAPSQPPTRGVKPPDPQDDEDDATDTSGSQSLVPPASPAPVPIRDANASPAPATEGNVQAASDAAGASPATTGPAWLTLNLPVSAAEEVAALTAAAIEAAPATPATAPARSPPPPTDDAAAAQLPIVVQAVLPAPPGLEIVAPPVRSTNPAAQAQPRSDVAESQTETLPPPPASLAQLLANVRFTASAATTGTAQANLPTTVSLVAGTAGQPAAAAPSRVQIALFVTPLAAPASLPIPPRSDPSPQDPPPQSEATDAQGASTTGGTDADGTELAGSLPQHPLISADHGAHHASETPSWSAADRQHTFDRLSAVIGNAFNQPGGHLRVDVSPPELGHLQLDVVQQQGGLAVRLEAQLPATHRLLVDNLPQLREALSQQGIQLDRIDVELGTNLSGGQQPRDGQQQAWQPPAFPPPAAPAKPLKSAIATAEEEQRAAAPAARRLTALDVRL